MLSQTKERSIKKIIVEQSNQIQSSILNYTTNRRLEEIKHRGYIDKIKYRENIRILSINVNRINLKNDKKNRFHNRI